jgi:hypothetical protein
MQNISEVKDLIDELENRIESYGDRSVWQKSNQTDWYTFIIEKGPKIVASWRELASLISLTPGDQLIELQRKWENIQQLMTNQEVLGIAMKYMKTSGAPQKEGE